MYEAQEVRGKHPRDNGEPTLESKTIVEEARAEWIKTGKKKIHEPTINEEGESESLQNFDRQLRLPIITDN